MKKKIYLAMLAVCFALTASACGDGGAVITDGTKTEGAADGKKAETRSELRVLCLLRM